MAVALGSARQVQGVTVTLSDTTPSPENKTPGAGTMPKASRGDHVHERLTATASGVLGASGEATVTFTRTFSVKPVVSILLVEATDNQPVIFKVKSWVLTGGLYTGCVIKGQRMTLLPVLTALSPLAILTSVVTGVNAIQSNLTGFNVANGNAVGAEYSFFAIQPS